MENDIKPLDDGISAISETNPKIYTKKAIWGFSIFFTSIFGGVLLFQNLKDIGKKSEANLILIFSIIFTVVTIYIVNIPENPRTSLTYICNLAGGLILTEYFFNKHFPSPDDYDKKKIWKPLIISIAILILIILLSMFSTIMMDLGT